MQLVKTTTAERERGADICYGISVLLKDGSKTPCKNYVLGFFLVLRDTRYFQLLKHFC